MRFHRLLLAILALSVIGAPLDAQRRSSRSSSGTVHVHGYTRRDGTHVAPYTRSAPRSYAAPRSPRSHSTPRAYRAPTTRPRAYASPDARGRTPRSRSARDRFMHSTGYPRGRHGYVVDHVVPLCAGGADAPSNMQWQTVEEGKVKDRQERATCAARRH
ncbi:MAG TPA: HNH endonuclease signature motif containing protein [Gemmatimonadaceae bacterium]|nr:HNH endonuclease signature motif containing protein [Gemmatimonadaceae bacterium]